MFDKDIKELEPLFEDGFDYETAIAMVAMTDRPYLRDLWAHWLDCAAL